MSLREEWQKEIQQIQLTKVQKNKMVADVQRGLRSNSVYRSDSRTRRDWRYPVVLGSFLAVALFFMLITLQPDYVSTPNIANHQGVVADETYNAHFYEILAWFGAVIILVILSIVQLVLVIFQTKRWDRYRFIQNARLYLRIQKQYIMVHMIAIVLGVLTFGFWFGFPLLYITSLFQTGSLQVSTMVSVAIVTSYLLYIHYRIAVQIDEKNVMKRVLLYQLMAIVMFTLLLLAVTTVFINEDPIAVLKIWLVLFIAANYCLWSLWMIRNEVRATCPQCGHTFSKREMLKKTFWGYKAKCSQCGNDLYMTRKARKKLDFISWFFPGMFLLLSNLGVSFWFTVGGMVVSWLFIMFMVVPYTMKFSTENEPLW